MKNIITSFIFALSAVALIYFGFMYSYDKPLPAPVGRVVDVQTTNLLPNSQLTPGATNPNIDQSNISQNICNPNWSTKSIRPVSSYTTKLKIQQIKQYGFSDTNPADYEEDHLISLELGGNPTDPNNLWPESYQTTPNAHDKDKVENELHKEVCAGTLTLKQAQTIISTDWVSFYKNKLGVQFGATSTFDEDDEGFVADIGK